MQFRMAGRGRPSAPPGLRRRRRRRVAVARLGDAGHEAGGRLLALGRLFLPRLRLRALLLRSRRALARLRDYYADVTKGLVADAAAAEPVKASSKMDGAEARKPVVVPAAVAAGAVLRCNSHYYIR